MQSPLGPRLSEERIHSDAGEGQVGPRLPIPIRPVEVVDDVLELHSRQDALDLIEIHLKA